jgi:hypothetical protein
MNNNTPSYGQPQLMYNNPQSVYYPTPVMPVMPVYNQPVVYNQPMYDPYGGN